MTLRETLRHKWLAALAHQLGYPSGLRGRLVGGMLNRRNRVNVTAAVDALSLGPGAVVADVGFGGGAGLDLLLKAVGDTGQVHGVEVSTTMLSRATHRLRRQIAAGRLHVHAASIVRLPFEDGYLDGAITVNTIYFLDDLQAAAAELARVLKGSGQLVVGLADPVAMADMPFTEYGFRTRPMTEVIDALNKAGLSVEVDRRVGEGDGAFHLLVAKICS